MYILEKISLLFLVSIQLVGVETLSYCMILELDINHWICMTRVTVIWFIVGKNSCWGSILSSVATIWCFPQLVYDNTCAHCILIPKNCIKGNIKPKHRLHVGNLYYVHLDNVQNCPECNKGCTKETNIWACPLGLQAQTMMY